MKQLLLFICKEFYHVFRDSRTLLMLFGLPIAEIVLFGFALSNEIKNTKIIVLNQANDERSRLLIDKMNTSLYFDVVAEIHSKHEMDQLLQTSSIRMCMVIPKGFSHALAHEHTATIQLVTDASDPNLANTIINYASAIIRDFQQANKISGNEPFAIKNEIRMMYNPQLKGAPNFVPGVMALVLMLVCVMMTSISIVREKEMGTMEILLVSPFRPMLVIIAKAIPYLLLSLVNVIVILVLSVGLLDLEIKGSLWLMMLESTLFIITCLSIGLFISTRTDSQQTAMLISFLGMMLPTLLFSGFMFPIENMPLPLQIVSNLVPAKWYYFIVKSVMIKGLGFSSIVKQSGILVLMSCVFLFLSFKNFKTRLA